MPELPEVQAHAERLTRDLGGCELARFEPLTFTALKTVNPPPDQAVGTALDRVGRRGKYLLLVFGELTFVVHLMQGGRLRPGAAEAGKRPRGGVARWRFADGRTLLLTEPGTERKAGVWTVTGEPEAQPPLDGLGPEADAVGADDLARLFGEHSMRLHSFLRDQRILAGVGRRLANEICWSARLSPFAQTRSLDSGDAEAVATALHDTIAEGLAADRARNDMSASRERPGAVHGRAGQPCPRCGDTVRAVEYRGYTVHYCPACQTGGKVLADRTTSKFLK